MQSEELMAGLRALADPTRLAIFRSLRERERCNCQLGDTLGLAPNLVSHHLRVLREAGLLATRRDDNDARWVYYSIDTAVVEQLRQELLALLDTTEIPVTGQCCQPEREDSEDNWACLTVAERGKA